MSLEVRQPLQAPVKILLACQKAILVFCSLLLAFVFFAVVILRYVFHADLFAYEEWVLVAAFWLYFIGGAQGSYENTHIKADFINAWVKNLKVKWAIANFTIFMEVLVGLVLSYWGYLMVLEDVAKYPDWPTTVVWKIPFVLPRLGIFIGLVLMTFYTSLHLYVGLRQGPSRTWEEEEAATGRGEGI